MSFEKQFPSLKDEDVLLLKECDEADYVEPYIHQEIVQKHCLDKSIVEKQYLSKQRVREVLEKMVFADNPEEINQTVFTILERLGLENEE